MTIRTRNEPKPGGVRSLLDDRCTVHATVVVPPAPAQATWRVSLAPETHAPRAARSAIAGAALIPPELLDDVQLLVSELVTNSVVHAGLRPHDRVEVVVTRVDRRLRVDASDSGTGFDPADAPAGRGLRIVEALADRWGVRRDRRAHVWFEYDLP